jgi:hypothetical protein
MDRPGRIRVAHAYAGAEGSAAAGAKPIVAAHGGVLAPVFRLYLLDTASVATNLLLQWRFGRRRAPAPATA